MNPLVPQLRADVVALATPAGRMVGSPGHVQARHFLCARMAELQLEDYGGASGYPLRYEQGGQEFFNLVGVLPGADRQARPILLGAHYDSVIDAPCADDNAAAVAITLATVELLRETRPARDVLVAFFDAEEPPYFLSQAMGSVRFVLDQMDGRGVGLAIIQDLTGHEVDVPFLPAAASVLLPRIKNLLFMTGAESHPALPDMVGGCLPSEGLSLIAALNEYVGDMSDHHIFRTLGLPYLFFSCGRWEHYHTRSDTPEKLAYGKMAAIAAFLARIARRCAVENFPKVTGEHDTTRFEVTLLRAALGKFLPLALPLLGLKQLESRADLDALAARLLSLGL